MEVILKKYLLQSFSFYDMLNAQEAAGIKEKSTRKEFKKGQVLFREDSFSKGIYIIRKGKVKIYQTTDEGKESILYIYRKGEFFGYRPLLANDPSPVTAKAMDHVVVSFIPAEAFNRLLSVSEQLSKRLLIMLSKEFSVWVNKVTVFTQLGVKQRVALSLLILSEVYQTSEKSGSKVVISISRDDLANFAGTATETLVRMLRVFKDSGVISSKGTNITLQKPRALMAFVNESFT